MKGSTTLASLGGCSEKGSRDILEQAKEELQILEAQQPNRFNYLKLELKSFISFLESHSLILSEKDECVKVLTWAATDSTSVSVSSSAATQGLFCLFNSSLLVSFLFFSFVCLRLRLCCWLFTASSTCKKRKKVVHENQETMEGQMHKFQRVDRLDAVFERARACLDKIQQFKQFISGES